MHVTAQLSRMSSESSEVMEVVDMDNGIYFLSFIKTVFKS